MKRMALCIVVLMLLCHMASGSGEFSQLTIQISTGLPTALPLEPLPITISLSNNTNSSIWTRVLPDSGKMEIFVKSEDGEFELFPAVGRPGGALLPSWLGGSVLKSRKVELSPGYRKQANNFLYFAHPTDLYYFDPKNFSKQHLLPKPGDYQIKAVLKSLVNEGKIESNILTVKVLHPTGENALAYEYMRNILKPDFLMRIFGADCREKERRFISAQEDFLKRFPNSKYARYVTYSLGYTYTKSEDYLDPGIKMLEQAADYEDFFFADRALNRLVMVSLKNDNVDKAQGYHNILKSRFPNSPTARAASYHINNVLLSRNYPPISEEAIRNIDISAIKGWVKNLESDDLSTRILAISNLKEEIGLDFCYDPNDPAGDDKRREIGLENWPKYSRNLEIAINTKIRLLLEKRTRRNEHQRAMAALFLGQSVPHPAFLPLLRKVIANNREDYYTRHHALTALTQIPHEGMVEFLIEQMDTDLAFRAWQQLRKLTRAPIGNDTDNWQDVKSRYEQWWQANKAGYVYERGLTMWES